MASHEPPIVETHDVGYILHNRHQKEGGIPTMRVSYFCNGHRFDEWVCFEHQGYARKLAQEWWRKHHTSPVPTTTDEALAYIGQLRAPKRIRVWMNKKPYAEILGYEY
jgi:DNA repair protein RadD